VGEFSVIHILVLAVILLVFFGPSRLPGLGQSIGKAIRGFKDGLSETTNDITQPTHRPNQQIHPTEAARTQAATDETVIEKEKQKTQS
jgi:sec-independent protein translocase protein TatA